MSSTIKDFQKPQRAPKVRLARTIGALTAVYFTVTLEFVQSLTIFYFYFSKPSLTVSGKLSRTILAHRAQSCG